MSSRLPLLEIHIDDDFTFFSLFWLPAELPSLRSFCRPRLVPGLLFVFDGESSSFIVVSRPPESFDSTRLRLFPDEIGGSCVCGRMKRQEEPFCTSLFDCSPGSAADCTDVVVCWDSGSVSPRLFRLLLLLPRFWKKFARDCRRVDLSFPYSTDQREHIYLWQWDQVSTFNFAVYCQCHDNLKLSLHNLAYL